MTLFYGSYGTVDERVVAMLKRLGHQFYHFPKDHVVDDRTVLLIQSDQKLDHPFERYTSAHGVVPLPKGAEQARGVVMVSKILDVLGGAQQKKRKARGTSDPSTRRLEDNALRTSVLAMTGWSFEPKRKAA